MKHSYLKLYYHFIWGTYKRCPILTPEIEAFLYPYMFQKAKLIGGIIFTANGTADHIHLLASFLPRINLAAFIQNLKGSSSHEISARIHHQSFSWQSGYGALTVSEKNVPDITNYIETQKIHHARNALVKSLESY